MFNSHKIEFVKYFASKLKRLQKFNLVHLLNSSTCNLRHKSKCLLVLLGSIGLEILLQNKMLHSKFKFSLTLKFISCATPVQTWTYFLQTKVQLVLSIFKFHFLSIQFLFLFDPVFSVYLLVMEVHSISLITFLEILIFQRVLRFIRY